ncbi:hypothetical protein [Thioalkalivibrio sp. ALMg11]|uniref:hypothetical protein n=1 Tax=Thioalkalivibrio sp. ALMg11 TaxID=1158165 RepID=UPI0003A049B3|nr:hypothetical protein [Thioalkalivibrio sp. ALMg11]
MLWLVIPGFFGAALSVSATVATLALGAFLLWKGWQAERLTGHHFRVFLALAYDDDRVYRLAKQIEREKRRPTRGDLREAMAEHAETLAKRGAKRLSERSAAPKGEPEPEPAAGTPDDEGRTTTEDAKQAHEDKMEARRQEKAKRLEARRKRLKEAKAASVA